MYYKVRIYFNVLESVLLKKFIFLKQTLFYFLVTVFKIFIIIIFLFIFFLSGFVYYMCVNIGRYTVQDDSVMYYNTTAAVARVRFTTTRVRLLWRGLLGDTKGGNDCGRARASDPAVLAYTMYARAARARSILLRVIARTPSEKIASSSSSSGSAGVVAVVVVVGARVISRRHT